MKVIAPELIVHICPHIASYIDKLHTQPFSWLVDPPSAPRKPPPPRVSSQGLRVIGTSPTAAGVLRYPPAPSSHALDKHIYTPPDAARPQASECAPGLLFATRREVDIRPSLSSILPLSFYCKPWPSRQPHPASPPAATPGT